MAFAAGNAQNIGSRQQQQDAFGFSDPGELGFVAHGGFLGIVADGVGGLTHGLEASQSAVRAFLQTYHSKAASESIPDALLRSFREANQAVLRVASEPSAKGAGTTLVAAVLHDHSLYWISAGDSRIYLLHAGRMTRVTADHTYARELDEQAAQGKISREEAQGHAERGALTSYLGQPEPKEIDRNTRPLALRGDDRVILCSDGFYRALTEPEIVAAFGNDLQKACETLVRQAVAKQRKGQDNLTVIALRQSGRSRKLRVGEPRGGERKPRVYAPVLLILALVCVGAYYWYEKPGASRAVTQPKAQTQPPAKGQEQPQTQIPGVDKKGGAVDKSPGKQSEANPSPKTTPPVVKVTKPTPQPPTQPPKQTTELPKQTTQPPKEPAIGEGGTVQTDSVSTPPTTHPESQGVPGEAATAAGSEAGAGTTATPASPAVEEKKSSPAESIPDGNQVKPPTTTAPTPNPQPSNPPDNPKNQPTAGAGTPAEARLQADGENAFQLPEPLWALVIKDGEYSCHS